MKSIVDFFVLVLTVIVIENAVFTRALGTGKITVLLGETKKILLFGFILTVVNLLSSLAAWGVEQELVRFEIPSSYRPLSFLFCICAVYLFLWVLLRYVKVENVRNLRGLLPITAFNSSVFASLLLSGGHGYGLREFLGFGLGISLGYTAALFVADMGMKRLAVSNVPKAFRGIPALLLYIGLLSLAFYGLIGHQLPA